MWPSTWECMPVFPPPSPLTNLFFLLLKNKCLVSLISWKLFILINLIIVPISWRWIIQSSRRWPVQFALVEKVAWEGWLPCTFWNVWIVLVVSIVFVFFFVRIRRHKLYQLENGTLNNFIWVFLLQFILWKVISLNRGKK